MAGPADDSRIEALRRMVAARPTDPRARFGLAVELERLGRWPDVVEQLEAYLSLADDEGNAFGRLARAYLHLGDEERAREAYERGIEAAERHGHPTLAMELSDELDAL